MSEEPQCPVLLLGLGCSTIDARNAISLKRRHRDEDSNKGNLLQELTFQRCYTRYSPETFCPHPSFIVVEERSTFMEGRNCFKMKIKLLQLHTVVVNFVHRDRPASLEYCRNAVPRTCSLLRRPQSS